jgi:hypothetical protein
MPVTVPAVYRPEVSTVPPVALQAREGVAIEPSLSVTVVLNCAV